MPRQRLALLVVLLLPSLAAPSLHAQGGAGATRFLIGLEQRTRFEGLTNRFRIDEAGPTRLLALRTRLRFELREGLGPARLLLELQDSRGKWADTDLVAPARHVNEVDVKQLRLQLDSPDLFGTQLTTELQLGRFTMDLGKRRLSARNRMRNTTNAFDGLHWKLTRSNRWSWQAFITRPVVLEPHELDSSSGERHFWGGYYEEWRRRVDFDVYYLGLREVEGLPVWRKLTTLGGRVHERPERGQPDFEIESTWQLGRVNGLDHRAHFQHLEVGYVFDSLWDSRLSLHYDYASGDQDPDDERFGRFSTLFGARRFEFNPTGIYGPFFRSNLHTPGLRLVAIPHARLEVVTSFRLFWLAEPRDGWIGSGLSDPSGQAGSRLGEHFETRLRWRPRPSLMVELGYGHLFKGPYLDRVPQSPQTPDCDFFYAAIELRAPLLER